jgi:hypothetical protein
VSALDLAATMDGIAAQVVAWGGVPNAYAYPVDSITVPCVVVGYPTTLEIAVTFGRGGDHAVFPVWVVTGRTSTKDARDALSVALEGGSDLVAAIEGTYSYGDVDVTEATIATFTSAGVEYISLELTVDVTT